jgi:pimeloyl-ACP methyl ester carboxylesterase
MRRVGLSTGVELALRESGEGIPVMLLHAWGETHRSFDRLVPLLPGSLRVLVPDQRGVGDSSKPSTGYALRDAVDDVIGLLDALHLDASWLVGTSSGGYLAQQVAVDHPERVLGLVLVGAPSDLQQPLAVTLADMLSGFSDPVTRDDVNRLNGVLSLPDTIPETFLEDQLTAATTIPKKVWFAALEGLVTAEPPFRTGPIAARTLILRGADDDVLPADQAEQLAAAIPQSRLVSYEVTGHLVLWEQPQRVAADLIAFIASASATTSAPRD